MKRLLIYMAMLFTAVVAYGGGKTDSLTVGGYNVQTVDPSISPYLLTSAPTVTIQRVNGWVQQLDCATNTVLTINTNDLSSTNLWNFRFSVRPNAYSLTWDTNYFNVANITTLATGTFTVVSGVLPVGGTKIELFNTVMGPASAQTPWVTAINAASYGLTNFSYLYSKSNAFSFNTTNAATGIVQIRDVNPGDVPLRIYHAENNNLMEFFDLDHGHVTLAINRYGFLVSSEDMNIETGSGKNLVLNHASGAETERVILSTTYASTLSTANVTGGVARVGGSFAPTSGNSAFNALEIRPTINQTSSANGATVGIYIQPILTSALGKWLAMKIQVGDIDMGVNGITNLGVITFTNGSQLSRADDLATTNWVLGKSYITNEASFLSWLDTNTYVKTETEPAFTNWLATNTQSGATGPYTNFTLTQVQNLTNNALADGSKPWTNSVVTTNMNQYAGVSTVTGLLNSVAFPTSFESVPFVVVTMGTNADMLLTPSVVEATVAGFVYKVMDTAGINANAYQVQWVASKATSTGVNGTSVPTQYVLTSAPTVTVSLANGYYQILDVTNNVDSFTINTNGWANSDTYRFDIRMNSFSFSWDTNYFMITNLVVNTNVYAPIVGIRAYNDTKIEVR